MITEPSGRPSPTRKVAVTPLGYVDHSPFGGARAQLVYGQRADGSHVHISQVPRLGRERFICPACEQPIVARKGPQRIDHFGHKQGQAGGCGLGVETNAHLWAKAVLEQERRIRLPAVRAGDRIVFPSRIHAFDSVRLEKHDGDLVPDIVVTSKGQEMWIEVLVTHACGPEKIAKIRQKDRSVIEVDLSAFRKSQDYAAIRQAFLETADRAWLYNRWQEAALAEDRAKAEAEAAAKAQALAQRARTMAALAARVRVAAPVETVRVDHQHVFDLGLGERIVYRGLAKAGFIVGPAYWQAALYTRLILPHAQAQPPNDTFDEFDALALLGDCLARQFRKPISRDVLSVARKLGEDLACPRDAIVSYLTALEEDGYLERETWEIWRVAPAERTHLRDRQHRHQVIAARETDLRRRVGDLLPHARPHDALAFELEIWLHRRVHADTAPKALLSASPAQWRDFERALDLVEAMARGGRPAPDLLGLPLAPLAEEAAERERLAQAERDRLNAEREAEAAAARRLTLEGEARRLLDRDAATWLGQGDGEGRTPLDLALQSPQGLTKATQSLNGYLAARVEAAKQAQLAASSLEKLWRASRKVFDDRLAWLFIDSGQPRLGNKTPRAVCKDETSLKACLALLPRKRQRDTL